MQRVTTVMMATLLMLSIVGYPLAGLIASIGDVESGVTSLPFRVLVVILAIVSAALAQWQFAAITRLRWLLGFFLVYAARLMWDIQVEHIPKAGDAAMFFAATTIAPVAALMFLSREQFSQRDVAGIIGFSAGVIATLAAVAAPMGWVAHRTLDPEKYGGRLLLEALNPISLGHVATTALVALAIWWRESNSWMYRGLAVAVSLGSLESLLLAGSRGPVLSLAICAVVLVARSGKAQKMTAIVGLGLAFVFASSTLFQERFDVAGAIDESAQERIDIQSDALKQFARSPLFGNAYVEQVSLEYPHNLFIETAMATGLVGLALLTAMLAVGLRVAIGQFRNGMDLLPILTLQYFVAFQFSGAIWGMHPFWVLLASTLTLGLPAKRRSLSLSGGEPTRFR
jgi:O-antigen ligase